MLADRRVRSVAFAVAAFAGLLVLTQLVFPGGNTGAHGTPAAVLFRGALTGLVSSLTAVGIVLVYRTVRFVNFAQTAIGLGAGLLAFDLMQFTHVPFPIAVLAGLVCTGLIGFVVGVFTLRFQKAPRLVLTVLSIILATVIASFVPYIDRLGIFPAPETRTLTQISGEAIRAAVPFAGYHFHIGHFPVAFGYAEIFSAQLALVVLLGLGAFLRYSRAGTGMRAMAENAERATLLGISVAKLSIVMWIITGVLAGASVILSGLISVNPSTATMGFGAELLLPALAAAVIGRMRSLPVTVLASVGIFVAHDAWGWSFQDHEPLFTVILFGVVVAGLLFQHRSVTRTAEAEEASSWTASREQRPIPRALRSLPAVRYGRYALIGLGLIALAVFPFAVGTGATNLASTIALQAIVVLSIVVLTGWAGQVSLGQGGFVAIGAVVGGALSARAGVPFWFAVPLTALFVAAIAAVVGLPALRSRGLFLLVVTFAFAVAVPAVLFDERYFGWLLPKAVNRPTFFFIDFEDERSMYFLCVLALVGCIALLSALRRTRIGRNLIALRDNEPGVRSFGVPAVRTKLLAFAISGGLCGFAGAIFAHQGRGVAAASFAAQGSLNVFVSAVFGGVGSIGGALLGAAYFNAIYYFSSSVVVRALAGPTLTLALLYAAPGGVISLVSGARDAILGIIAERRHIDLTAFARDAEAEGDGLTPLAEPVSGTGLQALKTAYRFAVSSGIHSDTGRGSGVDAAARTRAEEAGVIELAALSDAEEART